MTLPNRLNVILFLVSIVGSCLVFLSGTGKQPETHSSPEKQIWALYHGWYGNPTNDGKWIRWRFRLHASGESVFEPPRQFPSRLLPQLGLYSSHDESVLETHCMQMKDYGIDSIIFDWWGLNGTDDHGEDNYGYTDKTLELLFPIAEKFGLKIGIFIPVVSSRTSETVLDSIRDAITKYGSKPNYLRLNNKPVIILQDPIFLFDFYKHRHDNIYLIGTLRERHDISMLSESQFDAVTSYYASDGFTWTSTLKHFGSITRECQQRGLEFVPTVGPGFDGLTEPFSAQQFRPRDGGKYFNTMFKAAIEAGPRIIMINSFNNWGESTQIEPAVETIERPFNNDLWTKHKTNPKTFLRGTLFFARQFKGQTGEENE